jgi:cardiolipin synthase
LMGEVDGWLTMIVVGRDVVILLMVGAAFAFTKIRSFPPSIWGKCSTAAQILFILSELMRLAGFEDALIVMPLKWIVAALGVWSGLDYMYRAIGLVRNQS